MLLTPTTSQAPADPGRCDENCCDENCCDGSASGSCGCDAGCC